MGANHRLAAFVRRPGSTVPRNSASNEHKVRFKLFFVPELACGQLMQLWGAALNGRTSTKDRICRYRCRMFPFAIHTTHHHSQSTACWPFLEQGSPSSSAEFLTSMTSQLFGMEEVYCSYHKWRRSEPGCECNGDFSPIDERLRSSRVVGHS